jgi:hypothetical protein
MSSIWAQKHILPNTCLPSLPYPNKAAASIFASEAAMLQSRRCIISRASMAATSPLPHTFIQTCCVLAEWFKYISHLYTSQFMSTFSPAMRCAAAVIGNKCHLHIIQCEGSLNHGLNTNLSLTKICCYRVVLYEKYARRAAGHLFHADRNAWPLLPCTPERKLLQSAFSNGLIELLKKTCLERLCDVLSMGTYLVENRTGACSLGRHD